MSKTEKKLIRLAFRTAVFERDRYCCRCCGRPGRDRQEGTGHLAFHKNLAGAILLLLDAHHIVSRQIMPNGGYVKENGITVCDECHLKAEEYWVTGHADPGFDPDDLFKIIGSSFEAAELASMALA